MQDTLFFCYGIDLAFLQVIQSFYSEPCWQGGSCCYLTLYWLEQITWVFSCCSHTDNSFLFILFFSTTFLCFLHLFGLFSPLVMIKNNKVGNSLSTKMKTKFNIKRMSNEKVLHGCFGVLMFLVFIKTISEHVIVKRSLQWVYWFIEPNLEKKITSICKYKNTETFIYLQVKLPVIVCACLQINLKKKQHIIRKIVYERIIKNKTKKRFCKIMQPQIS